MRGGGGAGFALFGLIASKARNRGFFEFWTIVRVDVDPALARKESPTTTHFFHLDRILDPAHREHAQFGDLLGTLTGIRI